MVTIRLLSLSKLKIFIKDYISYYVIGNLDILTFLFDSIVLKTHKGVKYDKSRTDSKGVFDFYPNVDLGNRVIFLSSVKPLLY